MKRLFSIVSLFAVFSALAFDVTSYVQDGLVANWDGLTRTADDITFDANNYLHWTDVKSGLVFTLTNAAVTAQGFYFNAGNANQGKGSYGFLGQSESSALLAVKNGLTIEILVSYPQANITGCTFSAPTASGVAFGAKAYADGVSQFCTAAYNNVDCRRFLYDGRAANATNTYVVTYTNVANKAQHFAKSVHVDGVEMSFDCSAPAKYWWGSMNDYFVIGAAAKGGSSPARQTICAVRVYNRVLGADEIVANSTVDKSRYLGIETATYEVGTNPVGVKGPNPPSGLYNTSLGADEVFSVADSMEDYDDDVRALALGEGHRIFLQNVLVQDGESDPEVKTAESFTHRIVDMKTSVTWNFTNEQVLVVTATEGGGSISGKVGWVPAADETVTLTAVPADGTRFFAWEGLPDGVEDPYAATLTLPLDRPYALKAKFVTQLYPGETYPGGYAFITANWTDPKSKVPAGADSASNDLEARFRTVGEFGAGDFDPNQLPGLLLLVR